MKLSIKVIPNARRSEVVEETGFLKVKVDAPAKEGKANKRLIEILAEHFKIPKSKIKILKGHNSKNKLVEILKE
ncbi:MAG: hypothetical protein B6D53_00960 [Candidatus Omnitrophica bacterium 4484_49]|nr:DUF167 domain-containing protein [Candidatus Omnitrophota bacterium]OQX84018.1 MAG: hypothetical protein B6D53_00960 [Candidatus Omnitrophica bacterium 4484_49]